MKNKKITVLPFIVTSLLILIFVEVMVQLGIIPDFIIPSPLGVALFLLENGSTLLMEHTLMTLGETILGFLAALIIGCILLFACISIHYLSNCFILLPYSLRPFQRLL